MTSSVNVSGTWKSLTSVSANVSGVWKKVTNAYVNVSGVWKQWWVAVSADWANIGAGTSPTFNADQTIQSAVTLRATTSAGTYGAGSKGFTVYKNGVSAGSLTGTFLVDGATLDVTVSAGDTVHYEATKGGVTGSFWNATITVTETGSGSTIDTFTIGNCSAP